MFLISSGTPCHHERGERKDDLRPKSKVFIRLAAALVHALAAVDWPFSGNEASSSIAETQLNTECSASGSVLTFSKRPEFQSSECTFEEDFCDETLNIATRNTCLWDLDTKSAYFLQFSIWFQNIG